MTTIDQKLRRALAGISGISGYPLLILMIGSLPRNFGQSSIGPSRPAFISSLLMETRASSMG